jgi:phosphohistidine phosphatase
VPSLLVLRHAKSDWSENEPDRDRPLAARGRRASAAIGRFIARVGELPDAAITSPATRAKETLRLVMEASNWTCPVRECDGLYGRGPDELLTELRAQPSSVELLLAVGHEPTWSEAVALLTGGSEVHMPTGAMARIDFGDLDWSAVGPGAGLLAWLVTPRIVE